MAKVYILQCEQYFKIGYTGSTVKRRLNSMTTANPFNIVSILEIDFKTTQLAQHAEKLLHKQYEAKWHKGEWYKLDISDIEEIRKKYSETSTLVNKPIPRPNDPSLNEKRNYWEERFWHKEDQLRSALRSVENVAEKFKNDIAQYKYKNKILSARNNTLEVMLERTKGIVNDKMVEARNHTLDQVIQQIQFIKESLNARK